MSKKGTKRARSAARGGIWTLCNRGAPNARLFHLAGTVRISIYALDARLCTRAAPLAHLHSLIFRGKLPVFKLQSLNSSEQSTWLPRARIPMLFDTRAVRDELATAPWTFNRGAGVARHVRNCRDAALARGMTFPGVHTILRMALS